MSEDELNNLMNRVHAGIRVFDYEGTDIPNIVLPEIQFQEIMSKVAGKAISVDTNLNILQDGLGHVFVEIAMTFSEGDIKEKILVNANEHVDFFELLAKTSMLALTPSESATDQGNVFMIQLPRPERAVNALEVIKRGLEGAKN